MQQLFTVKEYAAMKRVSENTVWRRIASGEIKVERFGRAVRIIPNSTVSGFEYVDLPAYLKIQSQQQPVSDGKAKRKKS